MALRTRLTRRNLLRTTALGLGSAFALGSYSQSLAAHPVPGSCLTTDEQTLAQLLNSQRSAKGLANIPLSKSLSLVAQTHVIDLVEHAPNTGTDSRGQECNLHSWSANGPWNSVCYTEDHAYAEGMWNKPRELTNNGYSGDGYEIAYGGTGSFVATPQLAINAWNTSPPHRAVMFNEDIWTGAVWKALGVGIYQGYAVMWFGEEADPLGSIDGCTQVLPQNKQIFLPAIHT